MPMTSGHGNDRDCGKRCRRGRRFLIPTHRVVCPTLMPSRRTFTLSGAELLRFEGQDSVASVMVVIDGRCRSHYSSLVAKGLLIAEIGF